MIGGKAEGLIRLQELELPVPPFVAVPVGEELDEAAVAALDEPLAVRSSAVGEDAADKSAAGQYETVLGVTRETLQSAVAHVRAATERAAAYGGGGTPSLRFLGAAGGHARIVRRGQLRVAHL